jgi:predicted DCC family thiol-disulfide oxidoreductase YuxK
MIIVFDAHCLLCSAWVQFLLKHDRRRVFRFASMQSEAGVALLAQAGLSITRLETLLLVDGARSWQHTAAIFRVLGQLGFPWQLGWIMWPLPAFIRDAIYRWFARNRYRLFGRSATCFLPAAGDRLRFIESKADMLNL